MENEVDAIGLKCPEPVMMLHAAIRGVASGEVVRLIATDPSTLRDVPKFCEFLGHVLLEQNHEAAYYTYCVKKVD